MSLPTITVIGNMKRIELKYTANGKAVTKFQVECAEKNSKGDWVNLYLSGECWEKSAEFVNQYFQDGSPAIVTGKLYTNVYEKQDGTKVYENKLLFPNVSFIPKDKGQANKAPEQGGYGNNQHQATQSNQTNKPTYEYQNAQGRPVPPPQRQAPQQPPEIDIDSDDIPF